MKPSKPLLRVALALCAAALCATNACSSSSDTPKGDTVDAGCDAASCMALPACTARLAGNVQGTADLGPNCGQIAPPQASDDGSAGAGGAADAGDSDADPGSTGYTLTFNGTSEQLASFALTIDLGSAPTAGSFSSETSASWSASATLASNPECELRAGTDTVPTGSFELQIDSVTPDTSAAHGSLSATLYVHSPPGMDCGIADNEEIQLSF